MNLRTSVLCVLAACAFPGRVAFAQGTPTCDNYDPYVLFGHNTYGYGHLTSAVRGPSYPCQAAKAVTEYTDPATGLERQAYFGVRTNHEALYGRDSVHHAADITVTYSVISNPWENVAAHGPFTTPWDYTVWWVDCTKTLVPSLNYTFDVPLPCPPLQGCADLGNPLIKLASGAGDAAWESPELVRLRMDAAFSPLATAGVSVENFIAGWVIQDECESGALFRYPEPLPAAGSGVGYAVQLATDLPGNTGYSPAYRGELTMSSHVGQNYPYAASEVVAEDSWLEFAIALMDENGSGGATAVGPYGVSGVGVRPPYDLRVTFDVLDRSDWSVAPPHGCGTAPVTWPHYATEDPGDPLQNDFTIQEWDETIPPNGDWKPVTPTAGLYQVVIPTTAKFVKMRFLAENNDLQVGTDHESHEVVHLHLTDVQYVSPPPPPEFVPYVQLGWSTDFRFVIQDNGHCPF